MEESRWLEVTWKGLDGTGKSALGNERRLGGKEDLRGFVRILEELKGERFRGILEGMGRIRRRESKKMFMRILEDKRKCERF